MELSNTEIKIVVKNMAREMVKRAAVKNAMQFKYGDKVTVDGKYEGVVQAVKDGYYEVRIFDGSHVVGTRVCYPKDVTARNAAKNAPRLRGIYKDKNEAQARVDRENAKKENANEIHTIEKVGDEFHVVADKK